jgi:predicted enzyme related to lactoylglutathione lyase
MKLHSAIFYSTNIEALKPFYIDFLGLEIERESDGKFISLIFENGVRLGIKVGDKPREVGGSQTVFVEVKNIDDWYTKAIDAKMEIYKELVSQPWGKSFSVLDLDGNKVEFVEG